MNRPERKAKLQAQWTPERRAKQSAKMREQATTPGTFRDKVKERMTSANPMADPKTRERMRQSLTGRTFLARGGNGKLTQQQIAVAALFPEGVTEYAIGIPAEIRAQVESPPKCYRVDIGFAAQRLAIEIDGKTHLQALWRFIDKRKTHILSLLGWRVVRFKNADVDTRLSWVKAEIQRAIDETRE